MIVQGVRRIAGVYRRVVFGDAPIALVAANLIPLIGVAFFDWSLTTILAVYWIENGVVGFWNVPRIVLARRSATPGGRAALGRAAEAVSFVVNYGMFWLVHGVFVVYAIPTLLRGGSEGDIAWTSVALGALALFLHHSVAFVRWRRNGESELVTSAQQANAPYARMLVLHVTIVVGALAIGFLGAPLVLVAILVALKTALDLSLQRRERKRVAAALAREVATAAAAS